MQREELTERFAAFEGKHPVADWRWQGWRVWPVLRTRIALALLGGASGTETGAWRRPYRAERALAWRRQRMQRWLGERARAGADAPAEVVFLTSGDRAQRLDGRPYNAVVDPWAEAFIARGVPVTVWSLGDPRWRGHVPHVSVQRAIDRDRAARARAPIGEAPEWFPTLAAWAGESLGADLAWRDLAGDLRAVVAASTRFEGWLRRARPRALVLDCWYRREALGAALAARRLEIPVVDLQHGIQGHGHPCYARWSAPPAPAYEVFPDRFWVWGAWDAESLVAGSPGAIAPDQVDAVGHRWLSAWVEGRDPRERRALARAERRAGGRRAVLVSLQDAVPYRDTLAELIRQSPRDWLWWVRLHRRSNEKPRTVQAELARAAGRRVDAVWATREPLHALLRAASAHVTAFSTCALEALAFGLPTLLTHESGAHAYARFVSDGVMWAPGSAERGARLLAETPPELAEACRQAASHVFAPPADPLELLERAARGPVGALRAVR